MSVNYPNPQDSLFRSSLRKLLYTFFTTIGIFLGLIPILFLFSLMGNTNMETEKFQVGILPDLEGNTKLLGANTPAILQIDITGTIGSKKLQTEEIRNLLIQSRKGILSQDRVKAVLLKINSPGGTVDDSDGIYRLLLDYKRRYNTPIYVYIDGTCASGGMYIACAADKIYSSPSSVIGSIGVRVGPFFNAYEVLKKIGISSLTITAGKDKDALSPVRKWEEGEDKPLKAITDYLYNRFMMVVTHSRPLITAKQLKDQYGADVFDARTAEKIGLIDHGISNYDVALKDLLEIASIDPSKPYQIVELKTKATLATLFSEPSVLFGTREIVHKVQIGNYDLSLFNKGFSYLYAPELDGLDSSTSL